MEKSRFLIFILILAGYAGCREITVPRPRGYFRIDLPVKEYRSFSAASGKDGNPFSFEYPVYGNIAVEGEEITEPGWLNIEFPEFNARIYLTYRNVKGDLPDLIEQTYTMNVKNHISKADAINEQVISNDESKVYGILYDLKGNTATAVQFYVTDSTDHYLRGSLYFGSEPNPDSLAPLIDFFRDDILHLIETLRWDEK